MPAQLTTTLRRAPAPLALMGLIFFLSAQPDLSSGLGVADLFLRKLAHMTEYGLLTALWFWSLSPSLRPPLRRAIPAAAAIALVYAGSDEFHQRFVEGRHSTPVDVAIDLVGISVAVWLLRR